MLDLSTLDLAALLPFILIGFAAQLVDGALGMAFGVISNSLMVGVLGVPPALASQRVHVVECFTTATSGISHLLHGNIDKRLFFRLLLPGMAGGILASLIHDARFRVRSGHLLRLAVLRGRPASLAFVSPHSD